MRAITSHSEYRRSTLSGIALAILLAVLASIAIVAMYNVGAAHADTLDAGVAMVDAGQAGSGAVIVAPIVIAPVVVPPVAWHDPTVDATGFMKDVARLWHEGGWATALMLGLVGLLEILAWFGRTNPSLAWLGKGRISLVIGGGVAVVTAALNAAVGGGAWAAVLTAAVTAFLAVWHQAGTDPVKA